MTEDAGAADAAFRPLAGVRVADFSTNMAGPYATMILAQLGADVVKVEAPQGDDARHWPLPSTTAALFIVTSTRANAASCLICVRNRPRRSRSASYSGRSRAAWV